METSPKIVKLLFKNLKLLVQIFGDLESSNQTVPNAIVIDNVDAEHPDEAA